MGKIEIGSLTLLTEVSIERYHNASSGTGEYLSPSTQAWFAPFEDFPQRRLSKCLHLSGCLIHH